MKTLRVCGWAVIFTATLLLAACASHTPEVADTDTMSGPDTTMIQPEEQKQTLERQENALVIRQAWLDERQMRLDRRESNLDQRENALAINTAWLNERETRLMQGEDRGSNYVKLAGADSSLTRVETSLLAEAGSPRTKAEAGRCYATVVFPAEYKTVAVTKPIGLPEGENLPVLYQTVTEKVKVTDEQMRWEEILCEDSMTECRVIEIQRALSRGGYNPGPIDGIVGRQTMAAVNDFQEDFKLSVTDHLTIETVEALDVNY